MRAMSEAEARAQIEAQGGRYQDRVSGPRMQIYYVARVRQYWTIYPAGAGRVKIEKTRTCPCEG